MENKFAIGCLIQWYEAEIAKEYFDTLREAIKEYSGEVIVDMLVTTNEDLEKCISPEHKKYCIDKIISDAGDFSLNITEDLVTIADYRREFNQKYCNKVDILVWGETDMLVPKQIFLALNGLHSSVSTPKYIATFGCCKMWDTSWEPLEHSEFTNKPFIENDYTNWWSLKYTMTADEMNSFNDKVENLDVKIINPHKFNGCGLVISSEVIKAGVNIPNSVFFVHEDTSFMIMTQKILGNIPQYHFKNILLVHNRNHPKKRMYITNEIGDTMNQKRRSNDWYVKANKYSEENCYNLFNPNYKSKNWNDVWK
jgi:hypothetical protein